MGHPVVLFTPVCVDREEHGTRGPPAAVLHGVAAAVVHPGDDAPALNTAFSIVLVLNTVL